MGKKKVKIHEGRLRVLLQILKDKSAEIKIPLDRTGKNHETIYGYTDNSDYTLVELLETVWPDEEEYPYGATKGAIREYFRTKFEVINKETDKGRLHSAFEKLILNIQGTFNYGAGIENYNKKEELFFSGKHPIATGIQESYPELKLGIYNKFNSLFAHFSINGIPSKRRFSTELTIELFAPYRFHRYEKLENKAIDYLNKISMKQATDFNFNFLRLLEEYCQVLFPKKAFGNSNSDSKKSCLIPGYSTFNELSLFAPIPEQEVNSIDAVERFFTLFQDQEQWFDRFRFQKIDYKREYLLSTPVKKWPKFALEHVFLSFLELNIVVSEVLSLGKQIEQEVGFIIKYSKDAVEIHQTQEIKSVDKLIDVLSNYQFESTAFSEPVQSDGHFMKKPIRRKTTHLQEVSPSFKKSYKQTIEKKLWRYIITTLSQGLQLNSSYLTLFEDPLPFGRA